MNPISLVVVFVVIWWLVFFIALPIGITTEENPEKGNFKGAPSNPNLKKKAIITTIIAAILSVVYFYSVESGLFDILGRY